MGLEQMSEEIPVVRCAHGDRCQLVCQHLLSRESETYRRCWTGRGREFRLLCERCAADQDRSEVHAICQDCARFLHTGDCLGNIGCSEVAERSSDLSFSHRTIACVDLGEPIVAAEPFGPNQWVVVTQAGLLFRLNASDSVAIVLTKVELKHLNLLEGAVIRADPFGRFCAICERTGSRGAVYDTLTDSWTMSLGRGDYCAEHRHPSIAFFRLDNRTLLVHATDWNRLDISDPSDGRLLTDRGPISCERSQPSPTHHLDYFHCRLHTSPSGMYVAEDGWVWHPAGVARFWSLKAWYDENPWESENGASIRNLMWRNYAWDQPMCFADDQTLLVYGFGEDIDWLVPAALVFDVPSGRLRHWFPGPSGTFYFDRYLFSACYEQGTSVWDSNTGERLLLDSGLRPIAYHPLDHEFLSVLADGGLTLSRLRG